MTQRYTPCKLTDDEFRTAHKRGASLAEVGRLDGTNATRAWRRSRRLGLKFRNKTGPKPHADKHGPARSLRADGLSYEKIGAALQCSPSSAWWWCQE